MSILPLSAPRHDGPGRPNLLSGSKRRRSLRRAGIFAVLLLVLFVLGRSAGSTGWLPQFGKSSTSLDLDHLGTLPQLARPLPKTLPVITLVLVWYSTAMPIYFPLFFQSFAFQAQNNVRLLFVSIGSPHCVNIEKKIPVWTDNARNIDFHCIDEEEYWHMHAKYFCSKWHRHRDCGDYKSALHQEIFAKMVDDSVEDDGNGFYRLSRGLVFKEFMHKETEWWGWLDADIMLGNFRQSFPYDIAPSFDIILPIHRSNDRATMVFARGHMAFFRNSAKMERLILDYEPFRNQSSWQRMYPPAPFTEESAMSAYITRSSEIDMLVYHGLAPGGFTHTFSRSGIYSFNTHLPDDQRRATLQAIMRSEPQFTPTAPSFTEQGVTFNTSLVIGRWPAPRELWFDLKYATHYYPRMTYIEGDRDAPKDGSALGIGTQLRRYLIRKDGRLVERIEPLKAGLVASNPVDTWTYVHFQHEKNLQGFSNMPFAPLPVNSVFVLKEDKKLYILDSSGRHTFETTLRSYGDVV